MIENKFRSILYYVMQKFSLILPEMEVRPILISGTHRGGTTFVGTILAQANELRYVYEPLSPWFDDLSRDTYCPICGLNLNTWYPYIYEGNEKPYRTHFKHFNNSKRLMGKQPLYKDPLSPFAAEWLYKAYDTQVIFLLRNPLALVASCKQVDWGVPFDRLAHQNELLNTYLPQYKKEAKEFAKGNHTKLEETALLYNMVYEKAYELSQKYPDWIFIKHEDISSNPEQEFKQLFKRLGLEYSTTVKAKVDELTNAKNKAEGKDTKIHSIHRKSKDLTELWKKRLTKTEIDYVTKTCKRVAGLHGYDL
ncbi:sulfotransferase domain-containing protein [bacterium]|nr:MAG: sulfotransferase domain-containing protein [bacterium]